MITNPQEVKQKIPVSCLQSITEELKPDLDEAKYFLDLLGPGEDFTFQTFCESRVSRGKDPHARTFHGKLDAHADELKRINLQGGGVFVMVNAGDGKIHEGQKSFRTAANVMRVRALFVDLDGSPVEPVIQSVPSPSIVVESSPKRYHAYWLLRELALADFTPLQKRLAETFAADKSVCDLPRILRLPGFYHQKADPFMCRVISPKKELQ